MTFHFASLLFLFIANPKKFAMAKNFKSGKIKP